MKPIVLTSFPLLGIDAMDIVQALLVALVVMLYISWKRFEIVASKSAAAITEGSEAAVEELERKLDSIVHELRDIKEELGNIKLELYDRNDQS